MNFYCPSGSRRKKRRKGSSIRNLKPHRHLHLSMDYYQPIHLRVSLFGRCSSRRGECNEKRVPQVNGLDYYGPNLFAWIQVVRGCLNLFAQRMHGHTQTLLPRVVKALRTTAFQDVLYYRTKRGSNEVKEDLRKNKKKTHRSQKMSPSSRQAAE